MMTFHLLCLIHCCYILRCCSTLLLCSLLGGDLTLRHRQSCLYITSLPIFPNLPHHKNQSNLPSSSFSHLPHPPIFLILPSSSSPHPPQQPSKQPPQHQPLPPPPQLPQHPRKQSELKTYSYHRAHATHVLLAPTQLQQAPLRYK